MYSIKMESQKTINLPEKTFDNKDLPKKNVNKKRNKKEIKTEKPISVLILSVLIMILLYKRWNFKNF